MREIEKSKRLDRHILAIPIWPKNRKKATLDFYLAEYVAL
jgi:hypothetical protein